MREGSPNVFSKACSPNGLRPGAKSLLRNILALSRCGSRFCPDTLRSKLPKSSRINILGRLAGKIWSHRTQAKSLFWNILPASSCGSRFCTDQTRSAPSKSLRMNILEKRREKIEASVLSSCLARSLQTTPTKSGSGGKPIRAPGRIAPPRIKEQEGNSLTPPDAFCTIVGTSSVFNQMKVGPEFHAEWLRDEPYDATATDPGSYIPGAWCQLSPGNREHGIRNARIIWSRFPIASFPFPGKRGHSLFRPLFRGSSPAIRSDFEFTE